jgi:putative transposase
MVRRKIYNRERCVYFVTFSCYKRRRLLDDDAAKSIVLGTLNAQLRRLAGKCVGFVLMRNHVHALVWVPDPTHISDFMKQWKRTSSLRIAHLLATVLTRYSGQFDESPVWQGKYYGFNVYSENKLLEKLTYMHQNPVRAGLIKQASEWRWSSARFYEHGKSVGVPVTWLD